MNVVFRFKSNMQGDLGLLFTLLEIVYVCTLFVYVSDIIKVYYKNCKFVNHFFR